MYPTQMREDAAGVDKGAIVDLANLSRWSERRRVPRITAAAGAIVGACLLALAGVLKRWSQGRPAPLLDEDGWPLPGSLVEDPRH
jgi:hypothetical protein